MNTVDDHNPIEHFQKWFHEVDKAHPEDEANAMLLSTKGVDGFPKSRIVLLKRFTWEGFVFFTNYNSEKGRAIAKDNNVSVLFNWKKSKREVFISGKAEKLPENLSEGYFESRPEGSKLSAWVSNQSEVITSRKILEDRLKEYKVRFRNKTIPKPAYWGGYMIKPSHIEFVEQDPAMAVTYIVTYNLGFDFRWYKGMKNRKSCMF
ncbi:pyridoxamine 5'-phosphate oxidase [Aquimarina sp. BL5]|uniref:pyridoxamine 5'-phosphate oxidase n=1 Tax=Aquimarina sp. BL5 TaxID=1714860 RepID=UPI000E4FFE4E|nr:pyridoxamine 5'-phosphate oxidase [Aquimarina sp. BL5]AXT51090.1 pyridoxamine 5'-phosphate oxidase [Aquimarina sp. BL5]RKN06052.1 pyridoxamine 5'-phosphate oxidase [Aquimarina sp. BL5]